MSKKKQLWTIRVKEVNDYDVWFDKPVTKEEAEWMYEADDDLITEITDSDFVFLDCVVGVR